MSVLFDHDVTDGAPVFRFIQRLNELLEDGYGLTTKTKSRLTSTPSASLAICFPALHRAAACLAGRDGFARSGEQSMLRHAGQMSCKNIFHPLFQDAHPSLSHLPDPGGDATDEGPVVDDRQHTPGELNECLFKGLAAGNIQVVDGFVQEQQVAAPGDQAGQHEPGTLAETELADGQEDLVAGE
jgi:hypothetical protein